MNVLVSRELHTELLTGQINHILGQTYLHLLF